MSPGLTLIAALDRRRAIGREGKLPWRLPDDLKRFKALTLGKTVLMGRKTFESIGKPLPERRNLVISRDPGFRAGGVEVVHDLQQALALNDELMVIGGGDIYALCLPLAHRMRLTLVDTEVEGADAFFPEFNPVEWTETFRQFHPADEKHAYSFSFVDFERKVDSRRR